MDEIVRKDALQILNRVIEIVKIKDEKDALEFKDLSNRTIHNASVFQDDASLSIAVMIYALSKIIERKQNEMDYEKMLSYFEKAKKFMENSEEDNFKDAISAIFSEISKIDSQINLYIQEVISQAQIKKGSKLCEHGISCAKSAAILGISQWDLMGYLGKTKMHENMQGIIDVRARLKFARSLLQ